MEKKTKRVSIAVAVGGVSLLSLVGTFTDWCGVFPDDDGVTTAVDGGDVGDDSDSDGATTSTNSDTTEGEPTSADPQPTSADGTTDAGTASTTGSPTTTGEEPGESSGDDPDTGEDPGPVTFERVPWSCTNLGFARSWSGLSAGLTDAALWAQLDPMPSTGAVPLDANLYPSTDDHGRQWVMVWNFSGAEPAQRGSWHVRWDGPADGPRGTVAIASGTGCSVTGTLSDGFVLGNSNTDDECYRDDRCGCSLSIGGRIQNLRILKADEWVCNADLFSSYDGPGLCDDGSSRINLAEAYEQNPARWRFRPDFYAKMRPFKTIRFMMPSDINQDLGITSWDRRTQPTALTGYFTGMPYEHMLDLANTLGANAWVNVPWTAEDADVFGAGIAALAAIRLTDPTLKLILEWANEPWNGGFRLHQQSNTILPRRYGIVGEWPGGNQGAINVDAALKLTARETVRMCDAAMQFFPNERLSCAVNIQAGYIDPANPGYLGQTGYNNGTPTLRLLTELLAADTHDHVDIVSIAPYGNNLSIAAPPTEDAFLETWLAYLPSAELKMRYHANAVAVHNAQRAANGRPPLTLAAYEYNTDHFTAAGSGVNVDSVASQTRSVMRSVYHGDHPEVESGVYSSIMDWPALSDGRPSLGEVGPLCNFTFDTDSDGVWSFVPSQKPCSESAKCRAMLRALTPAAGM